MDIDETVFLIVMLGSYVTIRLLHVNPFIIASYLTFCILYWVCCIGKNF